MTKLSLPPPLPPCGPVIDSNNFVYFFLGLNFFFWNGETISADFPNVTQQRMLHQTNKFINNKNRITVGLCLLILAGDRRRCRMSQIFVRVGKSAWCTCNRRYVGVCNPFSVCAPNLTNSISYRVAYNQGNIGEI